MQSQRSLKLSHTQTSVPCGTLNNQIFNRRKHYRRLRSHDLQSAAFLSPYTRCLPAFLCRQLFRASCAPLTTTDDSTVLDRNGSLWEQFSPSSLSSISTTLISVATSVFREDLERDVTSSDSFSE